MYRVFTGKGCDLVHWSLETGQTREPLLPSRVLYGVLDLVGRHRAYAHQRILEVGADLEK
jgi:hypothetical protein